MPQFDLPAGARPIGDEIQNQFLDPLIEATLIALREVAATEVSPGPAFLTTTPLDFGERSALIELGFPSGTGALVLSVPEAAAHPLATRMLTGQDVVIEALLIDDCLGEIANVIAGQGKALLHGTVWHYTLGTPRVASGLGRSPFFEGRLEWFVLSFLSEFGILFLQVSVVTPAM
ncbi:MAG: chemotaxis protein CheX [Bryobacteraceae bacterium]